MLERCMSEEYQLCDSSILIAKNKIFFLASIKIPKTEHKLSEKNLVKASLSFMVPIQIEFKRKQYYLGNSEVYVHKRTAIQNALRRVQRETKFNTGGRGRTQKRKALEQFKEYEKNFMDTYLHQISKDLVDFCINRKAGTLELIDIKQNSEDAKSIPFILRNWSYYGFIDKIQYKCQQNNIILLKNDAGYTAVC